MGGRCDAACHATHVPFTELAASSRTRRWLLAGTALCAVAVMSAALVVALTWPGRDEVPLELGLPPEVDGNQVTVTYVSHPTDTDPQAEVEETDESVTITVTVDVGCSGSCTAEGKTGQVTVTLDEPLGSRQVKDGSDD